MENHKKILKKVGVALLVVGLLDVGVMIYCIINKISYFSSFNIFAVIAGVYLLKGSIRTARIVTFFGAFMLAVFSGLLVFFLFMEPLELRVISIRLHPASSIFSYVFVFIVISFVFWVYHNLSSKPVMAARKGAGLSYGRPKLSFAIGGILVVGLTVTMYFLNNSSSASIAKTKAAEQFGEEYKYHITSMSHSGSHVSAWLKAYRQEEIKEVHVEWTD